MMMAAVGTFKYGFDELLKAADQAALAFNLDGFAQTGHSQYAPRHLRAQPFYRQQELRAQLLRCNLLICHGGMGLVGDGLRAGCHVVIYPRRGATTKDHPANDQLAFSKAIAKKFPVFVCEDSSSLQSAIQECLNQPHARIVEPSSNVPDLVAHYLEKTGHSKTL